MSARHKYERRLIGQRTREALQVKKSQGVRLGRPRSLPGSVRARILSEREEGKTLQGIAEDLNREGVPTAQHGRRWYAGTVRKVLVTA